MNGLDGTNRRSRNTKRDEDDNRNEFLTLKGLSDEKWAKNLLLLLPSNRTIYESKEFENNVKYLLRICNSTKVCDKCYQMLEMI